MRPAVAAVHTAAISLDARRDLAVTGARGSHARSDFLLVRVVTSTGVEGYGEVSATPLWSGEDGATAAHFIREILAPALVGRPLTPVGGLELLMDRLLAGNPFTKAGVSIALWDAFARTLGVPLAVALGGPYRDEVPIKLSLSGDGPALDSVFQAATAAGFGAFKVKVGLGVAGDVARVSRARGLAGPETFLGADANGGWTRSQAARAIPALTEQGVSFVEQPVAPADLDGMRGLRNLGLPVVADESVFGEADLTALVRAEAADCVSLYVGKSGGPGRAVAMGRLASAFGIDALLGSNGELGIGAAAQLHVACALPALSREFPSDIIGAHYYAEDILEEPLDSDGRRVRLGDSPGLGVRPRADLMREFR
ncbi:dipeptide epimerase [Sphaerisporangium krabiense]|uniref:L-alanine-DL-glutamate epimerase-like enolase superfamily enzyme n=1 Tax=Sphaerisporangium krabiense TaxID=763782 RepID=A0A7W9DUH9_9ACTN|nr:enolase C-terminal domain-like protein [Sphaerisporangium krabiense]MBB5631776.1 L-alanine-DL-glutamate epimerase-like enolase superfamily enzyme [Sphaerisporangium krabiense]GII64039.1 dipeptide epimerase [Sphaerisporangium krabiense]